MSSMWRSKVQITDQIMDDDQTIYKNDEDMSREKWWEQGINEVTTFY